MGNATGGGEGGGCWPLFLFGAMMEEIGGFARRGDPVDPVVRSGLLCCRSTQVHTIVGLHKHKSR